jgi:propionate CoA-transferase
MRNKVITARQAAALIRDNDVVSISSSSGLGCPDFVLKGIGERFDEVHPKTSQP